MRWIDNMNEKIKNSIRTWLQVQKSSPYQIQIQELMDFELSAIRNRIWYRGDGNELEQLYAQCVEYADKYKFWASKSSAGMEIRKIHTGLPALMVDTLANIVMSDLQEIEFGSGKHKMLWDEFNADKDFRFLELLEKAVKDAMIVGDGAFKISIDTSISPYPIVEWVGGERVEIVRHRGRIKEIIFKSALPDSLILCEHYGNGYIKNKLYKHDTEIDFKTDPNTQDISDVIFDTSLIMAIPFSLSKSIKFEGRGASIIGSKVDAFDSLDEAWSQWMDALRAGRSRTYIPEALLPRNPETGQICKPNAFDNRYIAGGNDMSENARNEISVQQPNIPYDGYMATYVTALDLCLQGIISPSTLGIDVKKLDNAEAQREKEKATLYTRNKIISALQDTIPRLIQAILHTYQVLNKQALEKVEVNVPFGEYANPSFESVVETVGKGKTQGIMSIEACVEELYGESKDEKWKKEEVERLKAEQGIASFTEKGVGYASIDNGQSISNE